MHIDFMFENQCVPFPSIYSLDHCDKYFACLNLGDCKRRKPGTTIEQKQMVNLIASCKVSIETCQSKKGNGKIQNQVLLSVVLWFGVFTYSTETAVYGKMIGATLLRLED